MVVVFSDSFSIYHMENDLAQDQLLKVSDIPKRPLTIREVRSVVIRSSIEFLDPAFLHS